MKTAYFKTLHKVQIEIHAGKETLQLVCPTGCTMSVNYEGMPDQIDGFEQPSTVATKTRKDG